MLVHALKNGTKPWSISLFSIGALSFTISQIAMSMMSEIQRLTAPAG